MKKLKNYIFAQVSFITLASFVAQPVLASALQNDDEDFNNTAMLGDTQLSGLRGGFTINGINVSFNYTAITSINGEIQRITSFSDKDLQASIQAQVNKTLTNNGLQPTAGAGTTNTETANTTSTTTPTVTTASVTPTITTPTTPEYPSAPSTVVDSYTTPPSTPVDTAGATPEVPTASEIASIVTPTVPNTQEIASAVTPTTSETPTTTETTTPTVTTASVTTPTVTTPTVTETPSTASVTTPTVPNGLSVNVNGGSIQNLIPPSIIQNMDNNTVITMQQTLDLNLSNVPNIVNTQAMNQVNAQVNIQSITAFH